VLFRSNENRRRGLLWAWSAGRHAGIPGLYTLAMRNRIAGIGRRMAGVLAVLSVTLASCTSYTAPTLDVSSVRVRERTAQGVVLDFTFDADNSNAEALPLQSVRYTLYLDGNQVFSGYRSPEATLRRFGTQTITLPAVIPVGAGGPPRTGTVEYRLEGTLEYVTPGEIARILYDADIQRPTVSFREEGTIELGT